TDVVTANANSGGDTFQVGASNTGLTLNGGSGTDILTYAGYAPGTALSVTLSTSGSGGYASTNATGLARLTPINTLTGQGNSGDTLTGETVTAPAANTWTLGANNSYSDGAGNGNLTFSAFKVVTDAGSTADTFTISGATDVATANANSGGDTFQV